MDPAGTTPMWYWLCGMGGAVIAGGYKAASLGHQWDLTREHLTRGLGTVTAHAIIGAMIVGPRLSSLFQKIRKLDQANGSNLQLTNRRCPPSFRAEFNPSAARPQENLNRACRHESP